MIASEEARGLKSAEKEEVVIIVDMLKILLKKGCAKYVRNELKYRKYLATDCVKD